MLKTDLPIIKSIRTKLVLCVCALSVFIGALIYFPLSNILPKMITSQVLKRDLVIARFLSDGVTKSLLTDDKVELSLFLNNNLDKLEDAHYIFIQDMDGTIKAHTFSKGFPKGLLSFRLGFQDPYKIKEFLNEDKKMYDIAFPILDQELGVLHLGVSLESDKHDIAQISKINDYVAGIIFVGLGAGILLFLIIGFMFSSRIIRLKNLVTKIGQGDFEAKIDVKSKDEIGILALAFNEMALSLKEKIQEIKRLNIIEERNKIAFDLHDGCAQHSATIIKRIELCEKLFKIDSVKAFDELTELKESSKDTLNWTRQIIFDLKASENTEFHLINRIKDYLIAYKKRNNINTTLDVHGLLSDIAADRAKSIFYIITEALANAGKHSQAKKIEVYLDFTRDNSIIINIKDDGIGFDIHNAELSAYDQGKWGLISMRDRTQSLGGIFKIESASGQGTKVSVSMPLLKKTIA